jgi:hypothetical protein
MRQCLGGWCARRESCGHYHAEPDKWGTPPSERLCDTGKDKPTRLNDREASVDMHQAMHEAHLIMLQAAKYPETVNKKSATDARAAITYFCKLWLRAKQ